jgi:hypothetical protein
VFANSILSRIERKDLSFFHFVLIFNEGIQRIRRIRSVNMNSHMVEILSL